MTETKEPLEEPLDPASIDAILEGIRGFGIADTEQMVTMTVKGRTVNLRLSNLSPEDEIHSLIANSELKGHPWVQRMRCDLLAKAVTWINGVPVTDDLFATDPYTKEDRTVRAILRDMFARWGAQAVLVLWRIYMVHCQRLENNLIEQLPDAAIMTEVERRWMDLVADELKVVGVAALTGAMGEVPDTESVESTEG